MGSVVAARNDIVWVCGILRRGGSETRPYVVFPNSDFSVRCDS